MRFATVTVKCTLVFWYAHYTFCVEEPPVVREDLLHSSVHDRYRGLASMPASVSVPSPRRFDDGNRLDDLFDKLSVCCTRKRMLYNWIEDLLNATLPIREQVPGRKSRLEKHSRKFEPYTLTSCKAVMRSAQEAIAVMPEFLVQGPFPWKRRQWVLLKAFPVGYFMLVLRSASSIAINRKRRDWSFE